MSLRYVHLIGLELEGGWETPPKGKSHIHHDQSVCSGHVDGAGVKWPFIKNKAGKQLAHIGEVVSEPLHLDKALKWLEDHYPQGSNGSCGFHIHVSVRTPLQYRRLASRAFWVAFLEDVEAWGKAKNIPATHSFWSRLRGENRFCHKVFRPTAQMGRRDKPQQGPERDIRRTILNYSYAMHGTLECRLFPMWEDVALAKDSLLWFVNFVEGYLKKRATRFKEKRLQSTVLLSESAIRRRKERQ